MGTNILEGKASPVLWVYYTYPRRP